MPSLGAKISYTYNNRQQVEKITMGSKGTITNTYDGLNRKTGKSIDTSDRISYYYNYNERQDGQGANTNRINEVRISAGDNPAYSPCALGTYSYKYDNNGNITEIWRGGVKQYAYTYDGLNQLTSEEDVFNNKKIEYTYLKGGNFDTKVTTDLTTGTSEMVDYWYDDDRLIIYGEDEDLTFDEIGNPLKYRDGISFTWQYGRSLKQTKNSKYMIGYDYDDTGMRTGKYCLNQKNGEFKNSFYYYDGGKLVGMDSGDYHLMFFYDENGTPVRLTKKLLDGTEYVYYYITNLQGDVTGLTNVSGELICTYYYDAWGNPTGVKNYDTGAEITSETNISIMQPLRYRGYVYDNESGLYYLQSRYYDPVVGRFINPDGFVSTGQGILSSNMYVYCGNNPVMRSDGNGESAVDILEWGWSTAAVVSQLDSPLPGPADALGILIGIASAGNAVAEFIQNLTDKEAAKRKEAIAASDARTKPKTSFGFFAVKLCNPGIFIDYTVWYSLTEARNMVINGLSVYTILDMDAYELALYAGGFFPKSGNGEDLVKRGLNAKHYHLKDRMFGSHVFFGFQGIVGSKGYAGSIYPYG